MYKNRIGNCPELWQLCNFFGTHYHCDL